MFKVIFCLKRIHIICLSLILLGSIAGLTFSVVLQTPLAGNPIYPENEATEWTTIQQDQNLSAEDKIKATINTYFTLKYESWKRGEILDFAFLVDLSDPQASEDYAFERGLLYYLITGWKFWNALLISYDYDLTYNRIEIDGDQAIVMVFPLAQIVHKDTPDKVDPHSWTMHNFSLIKKTDRWLIKSIDVKDENHDIYPQGTNFNELAETFVERQENFLKAQKKYKQNESSENEKQKKRKEESLKKIEIRKQQYDEISGKYRVQELGEILFFVKDGYLVARFKNEEKELILQPFEDRTFEFEMRYKEENILKIQFIRDSEGIITKCIIDKGEKLLRGVKTSERIFDKLIYL